MAPTRIWPNPAWPLCQKTKETKKNILKKIWRDANLTNLRRITFLKWSTECSDDEFYADRQKFRNIFNNSTFVYCISQKLMKLEIWNKHQQLCTFFLCNLYSFQTNQPSVAAVSYVELEVKIYNFFVILTKKITCYMSLKIEYE